MSLDSFIPLEIPRLSGPVEQAERERARRRGHASGYAEGMRAARLAAERETERAEHERRAQLDAARIATTAALTALDRAAASFAERADALARLDAGRVMELAIDLAETILDRELADPVRAALLASTRAEEAASGAAGAIIAMSPPDLELLDRLGRRPDGVAVETSSELSPGDAVVRLADGEVDLRIDAALQRARAALAEVS